MRKANRPELMLAVFTWLVLVASLSVGVAYTISGIHALDVVLEPKRMLAMLLLAGIPFSLLLPFLAIAFLRRGRRLGLRIAFVLDVVALAIAVVAGWMLVPLLRFLI